MIFLPIENVGRKIIINYGILTWCSIRKFKKKYRKLNQCEDELYELFLKGKKDFRNEYNWTLNMKFIQFLRYFCSKHTGIVSTNSKESLLQSFNFDKA